MSSRPAHIHAVEDQTLDAAIRGGDYHQILLAQRREIVAVLPNEHGPAKAALHRLLTQISREVAALEAAEDSVTAVVARTADAPWDPSVI